MKTFYILLVLVFLASCGSEVAVTPVASTDSAVEQTSEEMDKAMEELPEEVVTTSEAEGVMEKPSDEVQPEAMEAKVVKLSAPYTNPAGPVDMEIEYSLDSEGKIEAMEVSATTYDLTGFNEIVQSVIGLNLEDASKVVTGSSLTGPAFSAALKSVK